MKYIKRFLSIIFKDEKRQILFVSFAFILYVLSLNKIDSNIVMSAIPAAVVAAGKAAAKIAAKNAAKKAAIGAAKGAVQKPQEGESRLKNAAKSGLKSGAKSFVDSGLGSAKDALAAKKGLDTAKNVSDAAKSKNEARKPTGEGSGLGGTGAGDALKNKPESVNDGASADKESKDGGKKKGLNLMPTGTGEGDGGTDFDEGSSQVLNKKVKIPGLGLIIGLVFFFFILMPSLMNFIISPTTKVINGFDCDNSSSIACEVAEGFKSFFEKTKNLFMFWEFATDEDVLVKKTQDVYDEFYEEYDIKIDIPLLLSSIMADGVNFLNDVDGDGNYTISASIRQRFDSVEDFAMLQVNLYETTYLCILDDNGEPAMQALTKTKFDGTKRQTKSCGKTNVGEKVYRYDYGLDTNDYYETLADNKDLLAKIYGEESVATEDDLENLISKIKLQKNTFEVFYGSDDDICASPGNIPYEALDDLEIALQNPLKGNYNITSYFGYREGAYSDHKGIDVTGDKNIYAAGNGVVSKTYTEELGGNIVVITHTSTDGKTYQTLYAHLKTILVKKGDSVVAGETIVGIMGSTGTGSTGVHLHFQFQEVDSNGSVIEYFNPLSLFVGAENYAYQCVGSEMTSDTCTSTGGSIAYYSNKKRYNYNLIKAIFAVRGIDEISETKNNIEFNDDSIEYFKQMKSTGTIEQKDILNKIDLVNKKIYYNDSWTSYVGYTTLAYVARNDFISKYGAVDFNVYRHVLMGVGKISGSDYSCLGYKSSKEMYQEWEGSHHTQVVDTIKYLAVCLSLESDLKELTPNEYRLQEIALDVASKYFNDNSIYNVNLYARSIVNKYNEYVESGESKEMLLNDCSNMDDVDESDSYKGGQCEMYVNYSACIANIKKYDNEEYWGKFIKEAGTSLSRIRLLSAAHELWGYARYCNDPTETYTSTGERCRLTGWFDSREFDPAWSLMVGPMHGDVLGGLDCGGFITRAYTTYIRRYFFEDKYAAFAGYKPNYVLHDQGMCNADTEYTTHYEFGAGNLQTYFSTHTLKPGDVLCDDSGSTHHVIMFIGWDDDNGNGIWDSSEMMYWMHTGDPNKGVEVYARSLSNVDNESKNLIYESYFTINDTVR